MVPYKKIIYNKYIMKASEAQKQASKKWEDENVESVRFRVPKGKRKLIQDCAAKNNESMNSMLNRLVDSEIKKVLKK